MNKIVVVGHPASGYREVQAMLHRWGVMEALPSRREGLSPQAITATLCKAHKMPPLDSVTEEEGFAQIEAAPVWQGMALDLMLGNLGQPLWGWADPQTIFAMGYWERLDPHLSFVLVYDEPHRVLFDVARTQSTGSDASPSEQDLRRLLDNWAAYNAALMRFHLRHVGRSLLVHAQQVHRAADRYIEHFQPLLDTPLAPSPGVASLLGPQVGFSSSGHSPLTLELSSALSVAGVEVEQAAIVLQAVPVERYLIDDVLKRNPAIMQIYAELQSVANIPLDAPPREAQGTAAVAWEALLRQRSLSARVMVRLHGEVRRAGDELALGRLALEEEKAARADAMEKLHEQTRQWDAQVRLFQERASAQAGELHNVEKEGEVLLAQLHRVQEELEQCYRRLTEAEHERESASKEFDEAKRDIAALKLQLGSVQSELSMGKRALSDQAAASAMALERVEEQARKSDARAKQFQERAELHARKLREVEEEGEILLNQLHQVQEELERCYIQLQESEREKESAAKSWDEAKREIGSLRFQLRAANSELRWQIECGRDLSVAPSRALLSTLIRKFVRKAMPPSARRRAETEAKALAARAQFELDLEIAQIRESALFDANWYLETYRDVAQAGEDAAVHFHLHGWKEGRRPGPDFDPAYYLATNPDVVEAGMNPLLHFLWYGASEGRQPKSD